MKSLVVIRCLPVTVMAIFLSACSSDNGAPSTNYKPADYTVVGKVEKGPFVNGSLINMQPYNNEMKLSGKSYNARITDNEGTFLFDTEKLETPIAEMAATGYYFNELKGQLSEGTLMLQSLVDVSMKKTVNVNILTHLMYPRIKYLMSEGASFEEANNKARNELYAAFGLQQYVSQDPSQLSITLGTDGAGVLIAVSSLMLRNRSDAEVTEYLAKLSKDFGDDGSFNTENKKQIRTDMAGLGDVLSNIESNIKNRYNDLGKTVTVKDLKKYFDWNNDGEAGNDVLLEGQAVKVDKENISVPVEGGNYIINIVSPIKLTLNSEARYEGIENDLPNNVTTGSSGLYETGATVPQMTCESKLNTEGNVLTINVKGNEYKNSLTKNLYVYDYSGVPVATIHILQEGNQNGIYKIPKLGSNGQAAMKYICGTMGEIRNLNISMDCGYTGLINNNFKAPLSSNNSTIEQAWNGYYRAINNILQIKMIDAQNLSAYQDFTNVLLCILYSDMIEMWGNVPYLVNPSTLGGVKYYTREELKAKLIADLTNAMKTLEEKKNESVTTIDNFLQVSKDVARITLAKLYMNSGKYDKAEPLLYAVFHGEYYTLDRSNTYQSTSSENIFGYSKSPQYTYSDALLLLSECDYHIGNSSNAMLYLNNVATAKGINMDGLGVLEGIEMVRKNAMKDYGGMFSFMKRSGIAKTELGLQDYQMLFPIPEKELMLDGYISQNPGY